MSSTSSKYNSFQMQLAALFFIDSVLLIPLMFVRTVAIILLGVLIYTHERQLKMLVPASPGFVFWLGNILSYVIGGVGLTLLLGGSDHFGIRYLNDALLYLGIGLSCYIIGMWLGGMLKRPNTPSNVFMDLNFSQTSVIILCAIFFIAALIGGGEEIETDYGHSVYYNLVIGSIQSIQVLPLILLSIYLLRKNPYWWMIILMFSSRFVIAIQGMLLGYGRGHLMDAVLIIVLAWCALHFWLHIKISNKAKLIFISLPLLIVVYFGIATSYRDTVRFDRSLNISERKEILIHAAHSSSSTNTFINSTLTTLLDRLTQAEGLELFGMAESGVNKYSGWTMNDLEQAIFVYVPKTWYPNKGVGLGRDIMVEYRFTVWNNIPPTLLGDSFRRSGLLGVMIVYFCMGFLATALTINLNNRWGSFGPLLALYLALTSFDLVSYDVMNIYKFYFYRIISSGLLIYFLLRFTGFLPKGSVKIKHPWTSPGFVDT